MADLYKKKAIELAKKIVRQKGYCEWCGKTPTKPGFLHGSHIMSVRYANTAADLDNILCLCYYCHMYRWHKNPFESTEWFNTKWPGRYDELNKKAQKIDKTLDFRTIYNQLKILDTTI